jgi:Zn-dependent protease with chaperone function
MSIPLALNQVPLKKEQDYFVIVAIIAGLCWLVLAVTIIGLIYGLLIALFVWLAHGLVIARFKSESVLVTEQQMPALYATYRDVVAKLGVREIPPLYIVQAHGLLNAFATRWSGRHFVIVYSDMLEACGEDTPQIRFLLGHELGHIRSNHIVKKLYLLPGTLFPLIGSAYSRACEASCDRFGAFAADDLHAAAQALLILAGGKNAWHTMDPTAFSEQYRRQRGFFISWHELTSGYPTLSQRAYNILTLDKSPQPVRARRNGWAYLFAIFTVGGMQGSGGNMLVTVAIVALLASIALPAFNGVRDKAIETKALSNAKMLGLACKQYAVDHDGNFPPSLGALYPTYVQNKAEFASPLNPSQPLGYNYAPGLGDYSPAETPLLEDRFAPEKHVRIVVFVDDSARIIPIPQ